MTVHQAQLRPGDLFFLYTDGVTEAEDPETRSSSGRIASKVSWPRKGTARARRNGLRASRRRCETFARGRSQFDDITCLALRR